MMELLIAILSAMLAYFLLRLDGIEKKIDKLENAFLQFPKRRSDFESWE